MPPHACLPIRTRSVAAWILLAVLAPPMIAAAQETPPEVEVFEVTRPEAYDPEADEAEPDAFDSNDAEVMVVRSLRTNQEITEVARSVVAFDEFELRDLLDQTTSVQEILGKVVPGFAPPVTEGSANSLTLRGRSPLFLIDGIPIAPNTNFSRFLDRFDPLTIERVEVVYGPTSLYGAGATGGVIQFFTRRPAEADYEVSVGTQTRFFIPDGAAFEDDGISTKVDARASARPTDWLSVLFFGSFEDARGVYRAEGDLLAGRNTFVDDITLFGKVQLDFSEDQRLVSTTNYTRVAPNDRFFDFIDDADAGDGTVIASRTPTPVSYSVEPENEFIFTSLQYTHEDLFGGRLGLLGYYTDSRFLNPGSDIRDFLAGIPVLDWPGLWQTGRENEEFGFRGDYSRDVLDLGKVTVGFDYNRADSTSLLVISSEDDFDTTLRFDGIDPNAEQTPPFNLEATGVFLQATLDVLEDFSVSGGVRWDRFAYEVEGPYDIVFAFPAGPLRRGERPGGSGRAQGFSFNAGVTYELFDQITLFGSFSEGFAIPELGFVGNNVAPGVPVSGSELIDPILTRSFEGGFRGRLGPLRLSFAGFFSESDRPTAVGIEPNSGVAVRDRRPTEIYGFELSGTWNVTERLDLEAALTIVEGQQEDPATGISEQVATQDVPPLKIFSALNYAMTDAFDVFTQMTYVGRRNEGFRSRTDSNRVDDYFLVDVGARYRFEIERWPALGGGALSLQITNLWNEAYVPAGEVSFIPGRIRSGLGRAMTLSYQHTF